jgi:hypothetical protein
MQIPCFLDVTGRVALQNRQNKGVACKIVQDKELREVSASTGRFRLKNDAKKMCRTVIERKSSGIIVLRSGEIICKDWPSGRAALARHGGSWFPTILLTGVPSTRTLCAGVEVRERIGHPEFLAISRVKRPAIR